MHGVPIHADLPRVNDSRGRVLTCRDDWNSKETVSLTRTHYRKDHLSVIPPTELPRWLCEVPFC